MLKKRLPFKKILAHALCAVIGAMLAQCRIISFPAPLAAVLPAVLPTSLGIASLAGILVGGLLGLSVDVIPLAAAAGAALISRLRIGWPSKRANFTVSSLSAGVYLMSSSALSAFSGGGVFDLLRSVIFSALLMAVIYVFMISSADIRSARGVPDFYLVFSCGVVVCALCSLHFGPVNLGGIATAYFVLFAAVRLGAAQSAAVAAVCALGAGICSPALFADFALLGIPAVICGLLFFGSPIKSSSLLIAVFAPLAVIFGTDSSIGLLLDCAIGSVVFVLTYSSSVRLSSDILRSEILPLHHGRTDVLRSALSDVSERLSAVAEKQLSDSRPLSDVIYSKVCLSCAKSSACFEDRGVQNTLLELDKISSPPELTDICRALPYCTRISDVRRVGSETYRRREYLNIKSAERANTLRLCSQMLAALDGVISDAERTALRSVGEDRLMTLRLRQSLKKCGVKYQSCAVYPNGSAEIIVSASARINAVKIAAAASEITCANYSEPERIELGDNMILRFEPKAEFSVEAGACQIPAGQDASGDVAETFVSGGCSYVILSDGMGVGNPARAVSMMLVNLLKELLCAGFSVETSVRLSGMILMSSMPEESFATLDILRVNMRTGAAELYKAGGCQSYLLADGAESVIRAGGYPVGILNSCELRIERFFVHDFAAVVMMTDGAAGLDSLACSKTVGSGYRLPSSELAAMLLQRAEPEKAVQKDDISVTVVKIERKSA